MRKKQSLFHISKRDTLPLSKALLIRGGILLLALVFCGLITTILTGKNPIDVYATILSGAFGTSRRIGVTFRNVAVLLGHLSGRYPRLQDALLEHRRRGSDDDRLPGHHHLHDPAWATRYPRPC